MSKSKFTLRDARRWVNRRAFQDFDFLRRAAEAAGIPPPCLDRVSMAWFLDRAISILGPNWTGETPPRKEGEERPKDTNEAAMAEAANAATAHGGNSALVESEAETASEKPRDGDPSTSGIGQSDAPEEAQETSEEVAPGATSYVSQWGGQTADHWKAKILARGLSREAKEVRRAMERLFKSLRVGTGSVQSPRLDGRKLAKELVSRRLSLARCKREELEHDVVLILVDESGSCSACSTETLAAALAIEAASAGSVRVEVHSNGIPFGEYPDAWKRRILKGVVGVVAFGDLDAIALFREIVQAGIRLVLLDSYLASAGPQRASKKLQSFQPDWGKGRSIIHYQGVSDAVSAAIALRMVAKEIRF